MSENKAKMWPQYVATMTICIGALGTGTALGWSSNITQDLKNGTLNDLKMTDEELSWAASTMPLGAMVVCLPIGLISNVIGRKPTVLLTVFPFILGWLLIMFSQHIAMIYAGRFLTGIAGGSFSVLAPLYTSEIAETGIRGMLGAFHQLFVTIGILYSAALGLTPMMVFHSLLLVVPIIFGVVFLFQSDTPVYLIRKGKDDKLPETYKKIRGKNYDPSVEINATKEQIAKERPGFWKTMRTKAAKKAMLICFTLMFFQQFSGISAIYFYSREMRFLINSNNPEVSVIITDIAHIGFAGYTCWQIKKNGIKEPLVASCLCTAVDALILGILLSLRVREVVSKDAFFWLDWFADIFFMILIVSFSLGLGPIPWLMPFELFPPEVKVACGSAAATFNWLLAFLITKFYFSMVSAINHDVIFYFITGLMIIGSCFLAFAIPETKGKTFAEIQAELETSLIDDDN